MSHRLSSFLLVVVLLCFFSSCSTINKVMNTDLAEEDFIIGKLYEDEYVKETPFVPVSPTGKPSASSPFDIARQGGKNPKLYDAIAPWMGTPYLYGGTTKKGVDCSAFVGHVYRDAYGVALHRVANDIQQDVVPVAKADLSEGDILFFVNTNKKVSHVGIYLHDGMFVHSSTSNGVSISTLSNSYWSKHFYRGGRLKR